MTFDQEPDPDPHGECAEEIYRLKTKLEETTQERDVLQAALRKLEWAGCRGWIVGYCLTCGEYKDEGHAAECPVNAALSQQEGNR